MPIRALPKIKQTETQTVENTNKEEPKMEMNHGMRIVSTPQTVAQNQETEVIVNPMDELTNCIEAPFHGGNTSSNLVRVTTSEQVMLVPNFFMQKNQSLASLFHLFRKKERLLTCSFVNELTTAHCRYHLFTSTPSA